MIFMIHDWWSRVGVVCDTTALEVGWSLARGNMAVVIRVRGRGLREGEGVAVSRRRGKPH